jgi:hypothetical protein
VFDALAELHQKRGDLVWILGVDLSHIGTRCGHRNPTRAGAGAMQDVEEHDRRRLERMCAGDAEGFFELVHPEVFGGEVRSGVGSSWS